MAMPRRIPIDFGVVFPFGAYAVGEVQPVRDYERSTRDNVVQAIDPDAGVPIWSVEVVDADPEAKKSNRTTAIKVSAKVQPVLPESMPSLPFAPIEFTGMSATAYIEENGDFSRIAWSLRATGIREPSRGPRANSTATPEKVGA